MRRSQSGFQARRYNVCARFTDEERKVSEYPVLSSGACRVCGDDRVLHHGYCASCLPASYIQPADFFDNPDYVKRRLGINA